MNSMTIVMDLKLYWKNFLFQSFLVIISIFIVLILFYAVQAVIAASLAATVFILFSVPKNAEAKTRNVIGGYLACILCGSLFSLIHTSIFFHELLICSIAVGSSFFIMTVLNIEHPPACGIALGLAIQGFDISLIIAVLLSIIILVSIKYLLKPLLKDLI